MYADKYNRSIYCSNRIVQISLLRAMKCGYQVMMHWINLANLRGTTIKHEDAVAWAAALGRMDACNEHNVVTSHDDQQNAPQASISKPCPHEVGGRGRSRSPAPTPERKRPRKAHVMTLTLTQPPLDCSIVLEKTTKSVRKAQPKKGPAKLKFYASLPLKGA